METGMTDFDEPIDDQVQQPSLRPSTQLNKMGEKGDFRMIQTSTFMSAGGKPLDHNAQEVYRHVMNPNEEGDLPSRNMQGATISPNLQ